MKYAILDADPFAASARGAQRAGQDLTVEARIGALLLGALVFLLNLRLQGDAALAADGIGWPVRLKFALCAVGGCYGLCYILRTLNSLDRFPAAWAALFGVWAVCTAPLALSVSHAVIGAAAFWSLLLFVPAVLETLGPRQTVFTIIGAGLLHQASQWILCFTVPDLGRSFDVYGEGGSGFRLGGDSQNLAFIAAWTLALLVAAAARRWVSWRAAALPGLVSVLTLIFAQGRTAAIAGIVAVGLVLARHMEKRLLVAGAATLAALVVAAAVLLGGGSIGPGEEWLTSAFSRSGESDEIYNLTGRTEIWPFVLSQVEKSPIAGYGYACSRLALEDYRFGREAVSGLRHAHNELLNQVVCTGVVGAGILAIMLLTQLVQLAWRPDDVADAILVVVIIGGLTESLVFSAAPGAHTIVWLTALFWRSYAPDDDLEAWEFGPLSVNGQFRMEFEKDALA